MICNVVGARPNFMKMAPIIRELKKYGMDQILVHTGQHYDKAMSQVFFDELELPRPDLYLEVGSDTHARQTANIMIGFEAFCLERRPELVIVSGDVNSTAAVALVCAKLQIPLAHVEAGLRSFDRTMPEEINRIVTDHIADLLFTTEESGNENLRNEGISAEKVHFVGNCMIDSLYRYLANAVDQKPWTRYGLQENSYGLLTLHRPSNVDDERELSAIMEIINSVAETLPVVFPVHPRTRKHLEGCCTMNKNIILSSPLPYLSFLGCMARARFILTDSGGVQEETTALGIPCLTMRNNTERPSTIVTGTNRLVGNDRSKIFDALNDILTGNYCKGEIPPLWDGKAAERVVGVIRSLWGS